MLFIETIQLYTTVDKVIFLTISKLNFSKYKYFFVKNFSCFTYFLHDILNFLII